ncbi:MAG: hypothetical protein HYZ16_03620 [Bacteroidetes bacterium]|jgi:hypothetical protein|nr:hypothetical protein [Bacteroidota bacterium]
MKRAFLGRDGSWLRLVLLALALCVLGLYSLAVKQYMLLIPTLLGILVLIRVFRDTRVRKG